MAKELNGTAIVLNNTTGEIVGQGDFTHTFGGTPIEIGNKSYGDNVTYLDGELSGKQHVFSGQFTYNNDAQFRKVRADSFTGTQDTYTLTYTGSGLVTDESFTGLFVPTGLSDSIPQGAKVTTDLSFNSSGDVTPTPAADA
jgi:hypothetical protein